MEILQQTQEVLDYSHRIGLDAGRRPDSIYRKLGYQPLYLYLVLNEQLPLVVN